MNKYMTKKQQLIDLLEKGFCVEIKNVQDLYITYYPILDLGGQYLNTINTFLFTEKNVIDTEHFTITKIYRQPIKPFKVGEKVMISESIKECDNFETWEEAINLEKIHTIFYCMNDIGGPIYSFEDREAPYISHEYLIPVIDSRKQVGEELEVEIEGELRLIKILK